MEKVGAIRLSVASSYDQNSSLEDVIQEYNKHFPRALLDTRSDLVKKYLKRSFDEIHCLVQLSERYDFNVMWNYFKIA